MNLSFTPNFEAFQDLSDSALLDEVYGTLATFINPAVPGYYPAEQMTGVIQDVRTNGRGVRKLLIKAPELSIPKWIALDRVQFPAQKQTTTEVVAA